MENSKEFTITALLFMSILIIANFAMVKYEMIHFTMNGQKFRQVGMMEYKNPVDNKTLYFLMYEKGDN